MKLELDIDTLVLDGVEGVDRAGFDRDRLAGSVRAHLGRLMGSADAGVFLGREDALGRQIAERVHGELSGRIPTGFDGGER
ncbi:MAG: hypothetical protein HC897_12765 [Thermoanaerobaculia bacterium]|nr:hypothetical protein [Thermoanaerobaculia bacterium]